MTQLSTPAATIDARPRFRVVQRIWENGRLIDEQTVLPSATFEQAATLSRRLTGDHVRTNNQDVTVSVEAVFNPAIGI